MGFDAEVTTAQEEKEQTQQHYNPDVYTQGPIIPYGLDGEHKYYNVNIEKGGFEPETATETQTVTALKIKTADYVGGGNITSKKGGTPSGKARNPGKGKSGNSSKGSERKTKDKDTQRYHEVTAQLKQNKAALDLVNKEKDRAFGKDRLEGIDKENALLQEQVKLYERLAKEAKGYIDASDRAGLQKWGATFNADGTIDNFEAWYDSLVDRYNSGSIDDDQWKQIEDLIKKYETALDKINEAEKGRLDAIYKIYDNNLEKVTYKVKTLNKILDQSVEYLKFLIKETDKSILDTADVVMLFGKEASDIMSKITNVRNGIAKMLSNENHAVSEEEIRKFLDTGEGLEELLEKVGKMTEKEISQLQSYQSELLQLTETLIELREEAYSKIGEAVDEFNEKIERQIDIVESLDKVMSHYKNVIDIAGKDALGISNELLKQMSDMSVTAAKSVLAITKNELDENNKILEDLYVRRKELQEKGLEEDIKLLDKEIEAQEDRVRELMESWANSFEEAMQVAQEKFKNTLALTVEEFEKAITGTAGSISNLQDAYEKQNTLNDVYLPTYEKIYNLSKLTRDVTNAINNTDNIKGKERLRDLQNDILEAQREGVELSKYDVEFMQKRLELELAQIAMEEAKNAKNMVRMTRDNEGN